MKKILFLSVLSLTLLLFITQCKKPTKDTTIPVITLKGANPQYVARDSVYVDPGYSAYDNKDGDITTKVIISGTVNTAIEGVYYRKYNVHDKAGNKAVEKSRKVIVMVF